MRQNARCEPVHSRGQTHSDAGKTKEIELERVSVPGAPRAAVGACESRKRKVDFEPYIVSYFAPHLYCHIGTSGAGCGASALSLITGVPPEQITARHRGRNYSDSLMVRYLRKRGYRVLHLTPEKLARSSRVGSRHVVLISQLFNDQEGTWGVIFGNTYYHNFQSYELSALSFMNRPILSAYLLLHPRWRITSPTKGGTRQGGGGMKVELGKMYPGSEFSSWRRWL